jgi:LPXTG-motif cell wall-anchored protein
MYLGIPQAIYLGLFLIELGLAIANNGKPKTGNESIWISLISSGLVLALLFWGGFFSK